MERRSQGTARPGTGRAGGNREQPAPARDGPGGIGNSPPRHGTGRGEQCHRSEAGMTLVETMIALAILLIVAAAVMSLGVFAIGTTENQGHLAARTTEYAQDKLEQLISLSYNDGGSSPCSGTGTNTTVFPTTLGTGTGLCEGGSSDPATPVTTPGTGYVDYLCADGNQVTVLGCTQANWYYIRVWEISTTGLTANMKRITVTAKVRFGVGSRGFGALAQSSVSTLKSNPF